MLILHVITGLDNGGAQSVLYRLITADASNQHQVISLTELGLYGPRLLDMGVCVHALNMPRGKLPLTKMYRLYRLIHRINPTIVQTWMYHADLVGGGIARLAGPWPVIWNLRNSDLSSAQRSKYTRITAKLCAICSYFVPRKIISCSRKAIQIHDALGYQNKKSIFVPNGYDLEDFVPKPDARSFFRQLWEVDERTILIGMVARWDPQKDHKSFFHALSKLRELGVTNFYCVLAGSSIDENNPALLALLEQFKLSSDSVQLLGDRNDISEIMNALDVHVLSSAYGEGFPNVVAEAMACGTPAVVTDVGDAAQLVGETGWIAQPSNPESLANAIFHAISAIKDNVAWSKRCYACRARIVQNFSLECMVKSYVEIWRESISSEPLVNSSVVQR